MMWFYCYFSSSSGSIARLTSPRKLVYERKRRNQYVLDAFIEWLNDDLICFIALDGDQGAAYLVTVNLAMEPEEEEK
ncbi:MAG: hypothetical protein AAFQ92_16415, partial [Bacteroidota bacterium]